jgi:hypothetical protein
MTFDAAVRSRNGCTERISPHQITCALAEAFSVILWPEEMLSAWLFPSRKATRTIVERYADTENAF